MSKTNFIAEADKQEIIITRIFNAPRELVFKAYTDPYMIPQWWGPAIYKTTIEQLDLRPGGIWRFVQVDSKGNVHAFHGVYHGITPPEKLVYTFEYEGTPGHVLLETIDFEDINGKTKIINKSVYQSIEDRNGMMNAGMEDGVRESMERLETLLAEHVLLQRS